MWTRAELKSQAKNVLRGSYWDSVVVCLIVAGISLGGSLLMRLVPAVSVFGSTVLTLFVLLPLTVGTDFFFMQSRLAPPQNRKLFYAFESNRYMKIVGAMAWQYLFIFLWSLIPSTGLSILLVSILVSMFPYGMMNFPTDGFPADGFPAGSIPDISFVWSPFTAVCLVIFAAGMIIVIMKEIGYSMTPFILTDNPYIGYARALKLSISMTYGHRWRIFVLSLSFIGWFLLCMLTAFIGLIFLMPYIKATYTELYVRLRDEAIRNGLTSPQELNLIAVQPPQGGQDAPPPEA